MKTATTGTGTIALGAAVTDVIRGYYQTFGAAGVANGDVVPYLIEDGASWEIGIGTYVASGTQLQRTTVLSNSAGATSAISLSGAAEVAIALIEGMVGLSAAVYRAMTSGKLITTDAVVAGMEEVPLSISGGNVAWDMRDGTNFLIPLTANAVLLDPSFYVPNKTGRFRIAQSGAFTLGVGSGFKTPGGKGLEVTSGAGAEDYGFYDCVAANKVVITLLKDVK
ncbi:hypothetical protein [Kaistia adipata]|uniref:hypothetical protein n=1 Tax=Kaistia adipata TaxID=166954 RepID=UPI0012ECA8F8|nr:hypothetical protein [Kaistia adipata]